ncbi:MAG: T9SS type A sorting domain-containing protein [Crocinitomicaceae bacterium]|nr:T9SS type A sorting domain-containing protein [Crocinitomicaceae bacterium]
MISKLQISMLVLALSIFQSAIAQTPEWSWAKSAGETDYQEGSTMATDGNGNVFVAGIFLNAPITFGTTTLQNQGLYDVFLVKYDPLGNVLWATSYGGAGSDYPIAMEIDTAGNIFIAGHFDGVNTTFGNFNLVNQGSSLSKDVFITKLDSSGDVLWLKSGGGEEEDAMGDMCLDKSGNVYVTGRFHSNTITFGGFTLYNQNNNQTTDVFVVKYDSDGTLLWAFSEGGTGYDRGQAISADSNGDIVVTGNFASPIFGIGMNSYTNSSGLEDIFIAKFGSSGNVIWSKKASGVKSEETTGAVIDRNGDIYVTGYSFSNSITFGSKVLIGTGNADPFLVKYNAAGTVLWAKSGGGIFNDYSFSLALDENDNAIISGFYTSPNLSFGGVTNTNPPIVADVYVVKFDHDGNALWFASAEGSLLSCPRAVCVDLSGKIFVTGYFTSPDLAFGQTILSSTPEIQKVFVAKLNSALLGINALSLKENSQVFPNPFSEQTTIKTATTVSNATLMLINSLGEVVAEYTELNGNEFIVAKGNLKNGLYVFKLVENKEIKASGKFVVND